jgi:hypothetical protein
MGTEYILNTIKVLLEQKKRFEPNGVPYRELCDAILEDVKMAINELCSEGRITFRQDINKMPIFYVNERPEVDA